MVAVGFSAGTGEGLWAIFVYFFVQNVDGYLVVPYIARRTVDLAPALVLAAQLLFGALFGILGLLLADPIVATIKVTLEKLSERDRATDMVEAAALPPSGPRDERRAKAYWPGGGAAPADSAALGATSSTRTSKLRSSLGPIGLPCGGLAP
jgi:hypothetical protein